MRPESARQLFSVAIHMLAADAGKTLQAAPGTNKRLVVTSLDVLVATSAAVAFDIESGDAAVELAKFSASTPVNIYNFKMFGGVPLPTNQSLVITAAAGNAVTVWAEGFIDIVAPAP